MMQIYTTVLGDMFDSIAKQFYGNERRMDVLISANPEHMETVLFSAGTVIRLPELSAEKRRQDTLPPWRK